jgi:putative ubiquitin-RnfH superfamily antitoxin RatB of RatAB toxin-antitoxin module
MVSEQLQIEVVYALPMNQTVLILKVNVGSSVEEVIRESGILARHPEINLATNKVGLFGHTVALTTKLDRVSRIEIYRPLIADPKEIRRQRAEKAKLQALK